MEFSNAFLGSPKQPSEVEVTAALGPTAKLWNEFIEWMAKDEGVAGQEWKGICANKYGWSLRLKQKSRNIVYLGPCRGAFRVAFALGDKAVAAARQSDLPQGIIKIINEARRYAEGTGVRIEIKKPKDIEIAKKLVAIKLAH